MNVFVDLNAKYQVFEGIGASGAWWAQEVGSWTHDADGSGRPARDRIAELLYNRTSGIGMRTYRYNLGAGSRESGAGDIPNPLRRTFLFENDQCAVYMAKAAAREGAGEIVMFVNSPPESLTKNRLSHCDKGRPMRDNLPAKNYEAFAGYVLDAAESFVADSLPLKYISPVNEPLWVWNGGQEGCHYSPFSAARVMRTFARGLAERPALAGVKFSGLENGDIRWFNKSYTRALLRSKEVRDVIDSVDIHSYFLNPSGMRGLTRPDYLRRYRRWMDRHYPGFPVKMSEWTHMKGGRDRTMDSALVMARTMIEDISILNAASWQHWIACSEVDYCDGLIYLDLPEKTFEMTKRYYVTGNFSKYVPQFSRRVGAAADSKDVDAVAFAGGDSVYVIAVNYSDKSVSADIRGCGDIQKIVVTDGERDLEERIPDGGLVLPPRSVTTVIAGEG